jgi:hypothetical protein
MVRVPLHELNVQAFFRGVTVDGGRRRRTIPGLRPRDLARGEDTYCLWIYLAGADSAQPNETYQGHQPNRLPVFCHFHSPFREFKAGFRPAFLNIS